MNVLLELDDYFFSICEFLDKNSLVKFSSTCFDIRYRIRYDFLNYKFNCTLKTLITSLYKKFAQTLNYTYSNISALN